jgi:hypothetical protein
VALNGSPLYGSSAPLRVFALGAFQEAWVLLGASNVSGSDALGSYSGTNCSYALASEPSQPFFSAAALTYAAAAASPSSSLVRFAYAFPAGASGTAHEPSKPAKSATIANFPGFSGATPLQNVLSWQDSFVQPQQAVAFGMAGGPLLAYGQDVAGPATVLSPLDQLLTSSLAEEVSSSTSCSNGVAGCFAAGTAASVTSLPAGFSQSWVLLADEGLTNTLFAWGSVLRAFNQATTVPDLSLSALGYQTDNGAQLCFGESLGVLSC